MYQSNERNGASGEFNPYAYDELYGFRRFAIRVDGPSQDQTEPKEGTDARTRWSLPIDLNQVTDQDNRCLDDEIEYVDMLPNCLEVNSNIKGKECTNVGLSKSMNDVIGLRTTNKDSL